MPKTNAAPSTSARCQARHPDGIYRCTLTAGHAGEHKHVYSGPLVDGWRRGTIWK